MNNLYILLLKYECVSYIENVSVGTKLRKFDMPSLKIMPVSYKVHSRLSSVATWCLLIIISIYFEFG